MPKTLMSYPRLSYGFSLILQLNLYLYSPIADFCISCEQRVERAVFGTILELREEKHEADRNVATSGQHEEEVYKWPTSRRQRDFSITIIKSKYGPEFEVIEIRTEEGTEREDSEPYQWRRQLLLYFSSFLKHC